MTKEQITDFLKNAPEEYVKVYEQRFKKVARKAFLDGMYHMAAYMEADGDYKVEWDESSEEFRAIKLRNDIDNAAGFPMSLNQYQEKAMQTCMPSCDNFSYMMLNLVAEVGEFAGKVAKAIRKEDVYIGGEKDMKGLSKLCIYPDFISECTEWDEELKKEAGDILWQLSGLCKVMGWTLEEVAQGNLDKLASRKKRGVIDGDGDNR